MSVLENSKNSQTRCATHGFFSPIYSHTSRQKPDLKNPGLDNTTNVWLGENTVFPQSPSVL